MPNNQLFRPAALNARRTKLLGDIVLVRPVSFAFLTMVTFVVAVAIVAYLIWGTYTKRTTVVGQLVPTCGLVQVYAPQSGIVLEKHVTEGQRVKQGEVLYVLSCDRKSNPRGGTQAYICNLIKAMQQSLHAEKDRTQRLQQEKESALSQKISTLQDEVAALNNQIADQRSLVKLAGNTVQRYKRLLAEKYISKEQFQQKQENLLNRRAQLESLRRQQITAINELKNQQNNLAELPLKNKNELVQIDNNLNNAAKELAQSEAKRRLVVVAPETGTATAVVAQIGQTFGTTRPLVSIVPMGARLQARLVAPTSAVGFIKVGETVLLRYQAYPYQKFGHYRGRVVSVSKTALPNDQIDALGRIAGGSGEPMYLIIVALCRQSIKAYGKPQPLQAGMLLQADILQDRRRLYEWALDPLYSLTGK